VLRCVDGELSGNWNSHLSLKKVLKLKIMNGSVAVPVNHGQDWVIIPANRDNLNIKFFAPPVALAVILVMVQHVTSTRRSNTNY
jgi:hypothetical protein